eukprot:gene5716-7889_t
MTSQLLIDYPYSKDIVESHYSALYNANARHELYLKTNNDRYIFENPLFTVTKSDNLLRRSTYTTPGLAIRTKDFLASIPTFADFTDEQLTALEQTATIAKFEPGQFIFYQNDPGELFYVINQGAVDVLIQDNKALLKKYDYGKIVNKLTEGCYFGERALMTSELRAASIRSVNMTVCLCFSRAVYEDIISGNKALIGKEAQESIDWSKDHETRSLFRHIENILEIEKLDTSPKIKRILYELSTAFTPELSADEVTARMVMTVKLALKVDRVGLFVLSEDKRSMILKVSERSKGVRLPVRGLAGAVVQENKAINIADAYQDSRFDATMDRRTGYRTRQILGVPLRHPLSGEPVGLLQVNNRLDTIPGGGLTTEGFTNEQKRVLEIAAEQLSELLHGRADVFIHSGGIGLQKSYGQGAGDGLVLLNSAEVNTPFTIELSILSLGPNLSEIIAKEGIVSLEIVISLHLSLSRLSTSKRISIDLTQLHPTSGTQNNSNILSNIQLQLRKRLDFDILMKDVPRATRVLFRLFGSKTRMKKSSIINNGNISSMNSNNNSLNVIAVNAPTSGPSNPSTFVSLAWTAAAIFDIKGCLDCMLDELKFFIVKETPREAAGETTSDSLDRNSTTRPDIEVPITTTLNNFNDPNAAVLSVILAPDLVLTSDSLTPRVRIVHSMPDRSEPIDAVAAMQLNSNTKDNGNQLSESYLREIDRIFKLSFNPMSASIISDTEKEFLWDLRYHLLNRAELLPAFVMCVKWNNSEHVQELYDLLDLWEQPTPVQALQLLDRRFMDPKVRAYAAHCLEDLGDDQLKLYMLQLCQQLKFENHIDSALSRFLLRRALTSRSLIGHLFFWLLQSEIDNPDVSKRFVSLLQIYLRNCGSHRLELGHQMFVMKKLEHVAEAVKLGESKEARKKILHARLAEVVPVLPTTFKLPLNPHRKMNGIVIAKCRVMESKKKPLWLTLKDTQGNDVVLMLKVGDDLRQDALIMQLLRVMNSLWKNEGLDMQMQLYDCISTGFERGLLEVVLNANTLGNILMEATDKSKKGGKSGSLTRKFNSALRALSDFDVLNQWIREQVQKEFDDALGGYEIYDGKEKDASLKGGAVDDEARTEEINKRVESFMISTAAYCVASYVLGLGDRHNDNLMMTKSGHFFHIDFGHILGNFKSKLGVKRERAPFVFTPAMKAVMTNEQYQSFVGLCCDIYNILREQSILLVSLFSLAIPCNLPELQEEKDVLWIYEKLLIEASDEEASEHFKKQLEISLNTRGTRLNDAAHMLAHA